MTEYKPAPTYQQINVAGGYYSKETWPELQKWIGDLSRDGFSVLVEVDQHKSRYTMNAIKQIRR